MLSERLGIIVLASDDAPSEQTLCARAAEAFSAAQTEVFVVRCAKRDRMSALNACLAKNMDAADRFIALDAALADDASLKAAVQQITQTHADILCCCDPAPKPAAFNRRRNRYVRYLCAQSAFWYFSENAMRRMRTADTNEFVQEALADEALGVSFLPKESVGRVDRASSAQMILSLLDVRAVLCAVSALASLGTIVFLIVLLRDLIALRQWNPAGVAGFLVCAHIALFSVGGLLIRWYRGSVALEKKARQHLYVEETREQ